MIKDNIGNVLKTLPDSTKLIAITKYRKDEEIQEVIDAGVLDLGENRVQELTAKMSRFSPSVRWHFVGHLQRNKVKDLVGRVHLIHSVDSLRLLRKIDQESAKAEVVTAILIQFNIAKEPQKYGFSTEDLSEVMAVLKTCDHVVLKGVMAMAPHTTDTAVQREVFRKLKEIYDRIISDYDLKNIAMDTLSMGMSNDYAIAVEEGSTAVRIGTKLFTGEEK
jgi:pyridoxal phosphate enzyme (YggS family)